MNTCEHYTINNFLSLGGLEQQLIILQISSTEVDKYQQTLTLKDIYFAQKKHDISIFQFSNGSV